MDLFLLSRYLSTFWQISYQSLKGPASSNNRSLFQGNLILTHYPPNTFSFDLYLGQAHIFPTIDTGKIFLLLSFSLGSSVAGLSHAHISAYIVSHMCLPWSSLCYPFLPILIIASTVPMNLNYILFITY